MNFWKSLKKPIMILAPMDDVTDTVFRQIVTSVGKPDVFFTEFTNVEALTSIGKDKVMDRLLFTPKERPIVAQIWGSKPEKFYEVAKMLSKMGFDGIDINMGCPEHKVVKSGACSALIKNPQLAKQIIQATIDGSVSAGRQIPVSVKTRIGFSDIQTSEWVSTLLDTNITALTLHFRTVKEMSKVPAHWEEARVAVAIKKQKNSNVLLIGNGDVKSLKEAEQKANEYGLDGIMIGRGIFENVWLFNQDKKIADISIPERLELLLKHIELFEKTWKNGKHFALLKKFVKCYINGFPGASDLRVNLMATNSLTELKNSVKKLTTES